MPRSELFVIGFGLGILSDAPEWISTHYEVVLQIFKIV